MGLIEKILAGKFDFAAMGEFIESLKTRFGAHADVKSIWDMIMGVIDSLAGILPIILIVLGLVEVFFGKKLMPLQKFLFVTVVGLVGGVLYIAPVINGFFALNALIVGAVIALVGAILNKFCYLVFYVALFGCIGYTYAFSGAIPVIGSMFAGNLVMSAVVAAVLVVLTLILRKYVEMAGTAYLGALLITTNVIENFFDYTAFGEIVGTIVIVAITLVGFIVQFKTRKRY